MEVALDTPSRLTVKSNGSFVLSKKLTIKTIASGVGIVNSNVL